MYGYWAINRYDRDAGDRQTMWYNISGHEQWSKQTLGSTTISFLSESKRKDSEGHHYIGHTTAAIDTNWKKLQMNNVWAICEYLINIILCNLTVNIEFVFGSILESTKRRLTVLHTICFCPCFSWYSNYLFLTYERVKTMQATLLGIFFCTTGAQSSYYSLDLKTITISNWKHKFF